MHIRAELFRVLAPAAEGSDAELRILVDIVCPDAISSAEARFRAVWGEPHMQEPKADQSAERFHRVWG